LAYVYDSTLGHQDEYFQPITPDGRQVENYSCFANPTRDLLLHEGDVVVFQGVKIEMLKHGSYDQVRLSRIP
jgi:hypothetical protein